MAVRITGAGVALTVGIIVVTGLIIGGFFWARHAGEQARQDEATQIAQQQLEDETNDGAALNGGDGATSGEGTNGAGESGGASSGGSTENSGSGTGTQNGTSNESSTNTGGSGTANGGGSTDTSTTDELPQTGPGETFMTALAIAGTVYAATLYVTSRRHLNEL